MGIVRDNFFETPKEIQTAYAAFVDFGIPSPVATKPFKYKIGDLVWQYTKEDDYDQAFITGYKVINGHNCYTTDILDIWQHEDLLI